jgi:hypothetical protein
MMVSCDFSCETTTKAELAAAAAMTADGFLAATPVQKCWVCSVFFRYDHERR